MKSVGVMAAGHLYSCWMWYFLSGTYKVKTTLILVYWFCCKWWNGYLWSITVISQPWFHQFIQSMILMKHVWICPSFSNLADVSSKSRTRYVHETMHWVFRMLIKQGCFVFVCLVWLLLHPHTCLIGYWDHAKGFPLVCGPMVTIYLVSKFLNPQKLGIPNACFITLEENIVLQVFLKLV
jgi:hypothetical protein